MEILKYKQFESKGSGIKKHFVDDFVIYQGRNSTSNDYVTFEIGDDEDIWFHAKGVPGSHVLIKVSDKLPSKDIIKQAAEIAVKNSKAISGEKVDVVYCKRRFVFKKPGMAPGQVSVDYKNADTITILKK